MTLSTRRAHSRRTPVIMEYLNPRFGYFYTVTRTLLRGKTRYQKIQMIDTPEFGAALLLDGITQVVTKNHFQYHEPMVHPAMCCHPRPQSVLIIGGGDGGTLREVAKYRTVKNIDFAELDEGVIRFAKKYLKQVHRGAFDDTRVSIHITDGRSFVEKHPGAYDVVIMDMTDPFGPSKYLYTREFFRAVKRSFRTTNGIFAMHTESPVSSPDNFNAIVTTLRSVFGHVQPMYLYIQMYAVLWSISICSDSAAVIRTNPAVIDRRLRATGIESLKLFTGKSFRAMKTAYPYIDEILRKKGRLLTDKMPDVPEVVYQSIAAAGPARRAATMKLV